MPKILPKKPVRLAILVVSVSFAKYLRTSLNLLSKILKRIYLFFNFSTPAAALAKS